MTEQTNAELIEEAATMLRHYGYGHLGDAVEREHEALEDADRALHGKGGWDEWIAEHVRIEQERDQYAAVVEKVRAWAGSHSGSTVSIIRSLLATAPADTLREVKAEVWEEGEKAGLRRADYEYGSAGFQVVKRNPYRKEQS